VSSASEVEYGRAVMPVNRDLVFTRTVSKVLLLLLMMMMIVTIWDAITHFYLRR
jgi:hypothetical protein